MTDMLGFALLEDENTHKLTARFEKAANGRVPDQAMFDEQLDVRRLSQCFIDLPRVRSFLQRCAEAAQSSSMVTVEDVIGERRAGNVEITLSSDRMQARLTVVAPQGGRSVSATDIFAAISAQGIVYGLDTAQLNAVIESGECSDCLIAQGVESVPDIPAHFESQIAHLTAEREVSEFEDVDFHELGELLLIDAGTPLLRRVPRVPGRNGMDICGREIVIKSAPEPAFAKGMSGARVDEADANLLVAEIAGQPKLMGNGASVNPVVELEHVDLESGNVDFKGTIKVRGDIKSGMSVTVTGDVVVGGTVEAAEVNAGGDVTVKGGIVGRSAAAGPQDTARITCDGTVRARFAERAEIDAGQSVMLDTAARQSTIYAGREVVVGKRLTGNSNIVGGQTRALLRVASSVIGSNSGTPTLVQVGVNPRLNAEFTQIEQTRKRKLDELTRIIQLITFFEQNPAKVQASMRDKAINTRDSLEYDIAELSQKLERLASQLQLADGAVMNIGRTIFGGVRMQIGAKLLNVLDERTGGTVRIFEGQIAIL